MKLKGHITLINPPNVYAADGTTLFSYPPIGLAYLASSLQLSGYEVDIVDCVGEFATQNRKVMFGASECWVGGATNDQIIERINPETKLIGISCMFMHHWPNTRIMINALSEAYPHIPLVGGGEQMTATWKQVLSETSLKAVCLGEGEETIVELADCILNKGDLKKIKGIACTVGDQAIANGSRARIRAIDDIPWPAWELVDLKTYQRKRLFQGPNKGVGMPIWATRGCPFQCTFCTSPNMWTTRWLPRDAKDVAAEMKMYKEKYGANDFHFVDLTAALKRSWLLEFCDALDEAGMTDISWQMPSGTRSEAIDYEVGKRLFETGCKIIVFAPESGSPRLLKAIKKKVNLEKMVDSIKSVRRAGMTVDCNLICGIPGETFTMILETWWFALRLSFYGVETIGYGGFRHTPGAELTEKMVDEGTLKLSDDLYLSVFSSISLYRGTKWHSKFSSRQIGLFRLIGYSLFFGSSFLFRPWRLARTISNTLTGKQQTRLDRVIFELLARRSLIRRTNAANDGA